MKKSIVTLLAVLLALIPSASAGAQTYEGTDLEDGIFFVPDAPAAGDDVNFAVTGLLPGSDLTFTLLDASSSEVDGLEVAGAIVLPVGPSGSFNGDISLPASLIEGASYTLSVSGTRADLTPFETEWSFVASGAASQTSDSDSLAFTGNESSSRAFSGVLLVVLGLGLVAVSASRRRNDSVSA